MKPSIAILFAILLSAEIGAGIFYQHSDSEKIVAALEAAKPTAAKWEYKVVACEDDVSEMRDYAKDHPETTPLDFRGQFDLMKIKIDGQEAGETDWDLCAWFLEPTHDNPKIILIFKRPVQ